MWSQAHAMPDPDPSFGELIAETRLRRGLSQRALARQVRASESSVKNWEAGRVRPSAVHLAALERALGVRFVDDGAGHYQALDAVPDTPPDAPRVVVVVVTSPDEAVEVVRRIQQGLDPTP